MAASDLSCSMWDLVPWAGFEPGSNALGVRSLSHWTTWEVPEGLYFKFCKSGETDGQRGMFSKLQLSRSNSTGHGTIDWFKIGKSITRSYIVTLLSPSMHSTSCKMPGWMNHKLESRLPGEISTTSICRWYHSNGRKQTGTKEPLNEGERGERNWLKNQHPKKLISWPLAPSLHGK